MSELPRPGTQPSAVDDLDQMLAAHPAGAGTSTQELAQLILMGMQRDIEAQIDWRLQQRTPARKAVQDTELGLILGSIGIGVPLTAIAAASAGLVGIIVIWVGLIVINVAWANRR